MAKSKLEKIRDKILILTNGKRSEANYFELLKSKYTSPYDINIKFLSGAPKYLAEYSVTIKNDYNRIFIVVDVDQYASSIKEAEVIIKPYKNTIDLVLSNIAFEVWLVNHYKQFSAVKTVKELIDDIDSYLESQGSTTTYAKNNKQIIEKYFIDNLPLAAKNTKVMYQRLSRDYQIINGKAPKALDLASISMLYKVVDALHLVKKS